MFSIFKKSKNIKNTETYTFSTLDIRAIGDKYTYRIKAKNKAEAFKQLFLYFYATEDLDCTGIKSESHTVTIPSKNVFQVEGMPAWFARMLNGGKPSDKDVKSFNKYIDDNNLNIEKK